MWWSLLSWNGKIFPSLGKSKLISYFPLKLLISPLDHLCLRPWVFSLLLFRFSLPSHWRGRKEVVNFNIFSVVRWNITLYKCMIAFNIMLNCCFYLYHWILSYLCRLKIPSPVFFTTIQVWPSQGCLFFKLIYFCITKHIFSIAQSLSFLFSYKSAKTSSFFS